MYIYIRTYIYTYTYIHTYIYIYIYIYNFFKQNHKSCFTSVKDYRQQTIQVSGFA